MFRLLGRLHPWAYMMIVVATFSAFPVLFELGDAEKSPFLFAGIQQISAGIGLGSAMLLFQRTLPAGMKFQFKAAAARIVTSRNKTGLMLASLIGSSEFVLLSLGLALVDVSVAAILLETWPLFFVLIMAVLFSDKDKAGQRYTPISAGTLLFILLAFAGVVLVVLSHNDTPLSLLAAGYYFTDIRSLLGAFLVLAAAIGGASRAACTLKLGVLLAKNRLRKETREERETRGNREIVFATVLTCICMAVAGVVFCAIGMAVSESVSTRQLSCAILTGLFVHSIGLLALRAANLTTDDLGVNTIGFVTPLVALIWLWMLSILNVPHLDYLIIGAMGIVAANLLINAEASKRDAYKALVVSLLVFGTFIYFTDGSPTNVPLELPVTMFILILAFRVDRLARRTHQEEEWVFQAFHRLKSLTYKKHIPDKAWKLLLDIDSHKSPEDLTTAYKELVGLHLEKSLGRRSKDSSHITEVTDIRHLVDKLVHSRQQGANFGEKVAIALAGTLIVTGLLFFNGDTANFTASSLPSFCRQSWCFSSSISWTWKKTGETRFWKRWRPGKSMQANLS